MTDQTIQLKEDGPVPKDVTVTRPGKVIFENKMSGKIKVTVETPGVFNPSPGSSFDIDKDGSSRVTAGNTNGSTNYSYDLDDGGAGLRSGTITVN